MKEITKYNRLSNYLNLLYDRLNERYFDGVLVRPVITIQSSSRAYAHYTLFDAWNVDGQGQREINIGAGTLDRPLEYVVGSLLHEMCHQYSDQILNVQDCSRGGTYHNINFYQTAITHGLECYKVNGYGYAKTEPSDSLIEFILENNDFKEIKICRNERPTAIPTSKPTPTAKPAGAGTLKGHSRRYICPKCGNRVRACKIVNVICGDCLLPMLEG